MSLPRAPVDIIAATASLRLIIEYARYKKVKLFVTYIDFSKAYDRVPRGKMFQVLKLLGCGAIMLGALMAL